MTAVSENILKIKERMVAAAKRAGRNPDSVQLVAVSKRQHPDLIQEAIEAGQLLFGENYLQDAMGKIDLFSPEIRWHFIGNLQSNKAAVAAQRFSCVETVDRFKLAKTLNKHAASANRILPVLVQVNIGEEPQKSGVMPGASADLLKSLAEFKNLQVRGLMAMPPYLANPEDVRPYFRKMRQMADELAGDGLLGMDSPIELSMGMSGDFEVAIEEGATLVRVGTAIFGARE